MQKLALLSTLTLLTACQAPITTSFHQALTDPNGYVLDVHNDSDKQLDCRVETNDHSISHEFQLPPNGEQHLGLLQVARSFKSQEHGQITVTGYPSHPFTAP